MERNGEMLGSSLMRAKLSLSLGTSLPPFFVMAFPRLVRGFIRAMLTRHGAGSGGADKPHTLQHKRPHELESRSQRRNLNPRALSPKLKRFVQARSWFQDFTPIVVT
jgi:hypothetical protein